jgi:hypothetical protein
MTIEFAIQFFGGSVTVLRQLREALAQPVKTYGDCARARQLLGLVPDPKLAFRHSSVHAHYRDKDIHPHTQSALLSLCRTDLERLSAAGRLFVEPKNSGTLSQSVVIVGSPTSEGLSRPLFGYEPDGESGDYLEFTDPPVDLPFRWELSRNSIGQNSTVLSSVRGRVLERPNWYVKGPGNNEVFIPESRNDRYLVRDYLLITRVPNYMTSEGFESGRYILSLGGTHGIGTRAVELFNGRLGLAALYALAQALPPGTQYYQALFCASNVRQENDESSVARRIEFVRALPLSYGETVWRDANRRFSANFQRWEPPREPPQLVSDPGAQFSVNTRSFIHPSDSDCAHRIDQS